MDKANASGAGPKTVTVRRKRPLTFAEQRRRWEAASARGHRLVEARGREHFRALSALGAAARAARRAERGEPEALGSVVRVRVRAGQDDRIGVIARSIGSSKAEIIRQAIDGWLADWEEARAEAAKHRQLACFQHGRRSRVE